MYVRTVIDFAEKVEAFRRGGYKMGEIWYNKRS